MTITIKEIRVRQPGDTVRVISRKEYEENKNNYFFSFDWGIGMCEYLGKELTVRRIERDGAIVRVYVNENDYYWLPAYIDRVVYSSSKMDAPSEDSLMGLLFL